MAQAECKSLKNTHNPFRDPPGHAVHAESTPLAAVLQRAFGADGIDAAKRQFGQTKDLATGPSTPQVSTLTGVVRAALPTAGRYA